MDLLNSIPIELELSRTNRFQTIFPKELKIQRWEVLDIDLPKFYDGIWLSMKIKCINSLTPYEDYGNLTERILDYCEKIKSLKIGERKIIINNLDQTGLEVDA